MKTLIIHNTYRVKGGEDQMVSAYGDALKSEKHTINYYIRGGTSQSFFSFISYLFPLPFIFSIRTYQELNKICQKHHPKVAFVFNIFPLFSLSVFKSLYNNNVPVVCCFQNYRLFPAFKKIHETNFSWSLVGLRKMLLPYGLIYPREVLYAIVSKIYWLSYLSRITKFFLVPSEFMKDQLVKCNVPPKKIFVIPNVCGKQYYKTRKRKTNTRDRITKILYIGRLSIEKGVDILISALSNNSSATLVVAGEGSESLRLRRLALATAPEHISFLGYISGIKKLTVLQEADIVVVPSVWPEPFGISAIEGMLSGACVIVSSAGALPYLVTHEKTGFVFHANSVTDLQKVLDYAIVHTQERIKIGRRAQERAMKYYSWIVLKNRLRSVLWLIGHDR